MESTLEELKSVVGTLKARMDVADSHAMETKQLLTGLRSDLGIFRSEVKRDLRLLRADQERLYNPLMSTATDDIARLHRNVEEIKRDVGDLKGEVGNLKRDVGDLKGEVGDLKRDVGDLKGEVGNLKRDVGDLKGEVGDLKRDVGDLKQGMGAIMRHFGVQATEEAGEP